jgi:hypothetical protein
MRMQFNVGDLVRVSYMDEPQSFVAKVGHHGTDGLFLERGLDEPIVRLACADECFFRDETQRVATVEVITSEEHVLEANTKNMAWMFDRLEAAMFKACGVSK